MGTEHTPGKFITADQWDKLKSEFPDLEDQQQEAIDIAMAVAWEFIPAGIPETPVTKAAPDLLDACELMLEANSMGTAMCSRQLAHEAIAKAKGD